MSDTHKPAGTSRVDAREGATTSVGGARPREGASQRMSNSLVALSSAVVLAVYSAGYLRTQAAADRFETEAGQRRPAPPGPLTAAAPAAPAAAPPTTAQSATLATTTAADTARAEAPTAAARSETSAAPTTLPAPVAPVASATARTESITAAPVAPAPVAAVVPTIATAVPPVASTAAAAPTPAPTAPAAPVKPRYKDGTFTGWGTSRHGDIQAQVIIADGRITSATIAQCMTRWPCSWIEALPGQVVARQSPETDYVSGATQSTNAFYYAVVQALGKAVAE